MGTVLLARPQYVARLRAAVRRAPVVAILGPRQCGKTTLARAFGEGRASTFFDLESEPDRRRLQNPESALGALEGLVVLDEIQRVPELFRVLRVLADRPRPRAKFLMLGSASPQLVREASESLAGRVELIELAGFDLGETGAATMRRLWSRGGFPRSFLADSDPDSMAWRESFVRTFLERDIPQLGITIPSPAMRRFWTMLAHWHGQRWNSSELARAMSLSDKTVRSYLDILTGTFMVRQLQPWFENISKRQVKAPKIYLRDSGLLHALLNLPEEHALRGNPIVGASWEGFAIEQFLLTVRPSDAYYWATQGGAEVDLVFEHRGRRHGVEVKHSEAPDVTRSMRTALEDLRLEKLWILHGGEHAWTVDERIEAWPVARIAELRAKFG
jgi:predicted AAA+ superfamily ATPase